MNFKTLVLAIALLSIFSCTNDELKAPASEADEIIAENQTTFPYGEPITIGESVYTFSEADVQVPQAAEEWLMENQSVGQRNCCSNGTCNTLVTVFLEVLDEASCEAILAVVNSCEGGALIGGDNWIAPLSPPLCVDQEITMDVLWLGDEPEDCATFRIWVFTNNNIPNGGWSYVEICADPSNFPYVGASNSIRLGEVINSMGSCGFVWDAELASGNNGGYTECLSFNCGVPPSPCYGL